MNGFILAEFATADAAMAAARGAAEAGIPAEDVLSPHPLTGVEEHLAPPARKPPIGWVMFVAAALAAVAGYAIQWYSAVIDYPIDSGGRPLHSWPAFLLVPYESAILLAAVVGVLALLWMCGLPKLFHPLFSASVVERVTQDRYVLVFRQRDELADRIQTTLQPRALYEHRE